MRYHIDHTSDQKAYMQLYSQLRADIVSGAYACGARLPSKRELAADSGVSVITSEHALALLCEEGYIESRQRSGFFVIYRQKDFGSSAPPVETVHIQHAHTTTGGFPFSVLARTMRRVLLDRGSDILVKSPNHGCHELRSALKSYLARSNGINVQPEQIIIGSGAEYLYSLIAQLLGRERSFGLENPSYEKIRQVYQACGITCDMLVMDKDGIKTSELQRTEAQVLHVTPFHSYPSGITAGASKRAEYLHWARQRSGYIIEDNFDSELTVSRKNEDTVFSLDDSGSVIYLNTFSRTIAPSIRVGYMLLPQRLLDDFDRQLGFYSCTVPVFEQYVLAELLNSGDFERSINRTRRARRRQLEQQEH
ncbi:MAG: PLP-dependent aminotransferase family protein [Ruminococcaceae bacterium]|nr:PLP-dependent aminotransferase family protein [Oscillospiraceae bacterium]